MKVDQQNFCLEKLDHQLHATVKMVWPTLQSLRSMGSILQTTKLGYVYDLLFQAGVVQVARRKNGAAYLPGLPRVIAETFAKSMLPVRNWCIVYDMSLDTALVELAQGHGRAVDVFAVDFPSVAENVYGFKDVRKITCHWENLLRRSVEVVWDDEANRYRAQLAGFPDLVVWGTSWSDALMHLERAAKIKRRIIALESLLK